MINEFCLHCKAYLQIHFIKFTVNHVIKICLNKYFGELLKQKQLLVNKEHAHFYSSEQKYIFHMN